MTVVAFKLKYLLLLLLAAAFIFVFITVDRFLFDPNSGLSKYYFDAYPQTEIFDPAIPAYKKYSMTPWFYYLLQCHSNAQLLAATFPLT